MTELSPVKKALLAIEDLKAKLAQAEAKLHGAIAIIGVACRFPGAPNVDTYWANLLRGVHAIRETPEDRWSSNLYDPEPTAPGKVATRWGGFLEQLDHFDARFFELLPKEAAAMDPQQRLLLETAWHALEHAHQKASSLRGSRTGVFVGIASSDYTGHQFADFAKIDGFMASGAAHSIAANRISYYFDFRGPSLAVDTACSSSLVSTHLAVQSLRRGESDLALACGVNVLISPVTSIAFSKAGFMAPDGRCKTFDAAANGYVRGEGCGILVLKRLADAQANGDRILAIIRGAAINQDGRTNGLTAPNQRAQEEVIRAALADARLPPEAITFIEAHGTGTALGDPIEIEALSRALGSGPPCLLSAVKTNIGHLEAAAGVAGLIKLTWALHHQTIPGLLHFSKLNPHLELGPRLTIATTTQPWPEHPQGRAGGVSSFGFGGTNAHLILAEAPAVPSKISDSVATWVPVSAKSEAALLARIQDLTTWLSQNPAAPVDLAHTFGHHRDHLRYRAFLMGATVSELIQSATKAKPTHHEQPRLALVYPGQGAQFAGMGRDLYQTEPVFRDVIDRCDELAHNSLQLKLSTLIFEGDRLEQTWLTQPALYAVGCALTELWRSWGVVADAVLGHSIGEISAAYAAGVYSLGDGLSLAIARGRAMQNVAEPGLMRAVFAPLDAVLPFLTSRTSIAAINGPEQLVVSGFATEIESICAQLEAKGFVTRPLRTSHAFHSPLMTPALGAIGEAARALTAQPPKLLLYSNLDAAPLRLAPGPEYWQKHALAPVRFGPALARMAQDGITTFLELGPGRQLTELATRANAPIIGIPTMLRERPAGLVAQAQLWSRGCAISPPSWRLGQKIDVPSYPFQRRRHWLDGAAPTSPAPETIGTSWVDSL